MEGNVRTRDRFRGSQRDHAGIEASQVFDVCVADVRRGSTDCVALQDDAEVIEVVDVRWRQSDHDSTAPRGDCYQPFVAEDAECLANRAAANPEMGGNLFLNLAYPWGQVTHQDCGSQDGKDRMVQFGTIVNHVTD